ncbi:MAG: fibronectin type III domain-containing protein, partial [Gemmatimonadaceae bacterium]
MTRISGLCAVVLLTGSLGAQSTPFFAAPTERGVVLRWVWNEGARPAGYFVERRSSSVAPWTRLTARPITRVRDRAAGRAIMGDQFERYSGLVFPEEPGAELADPETFRGMLLLSADLEPGVAQVLGLRYDDASAAAGSAYEYRLIELTASGERVAATSGAVIAGGYRSAGGPTGVAALAGPRGAALKWTSEPRFSGYQVYRGTRRDVTSARRLNDAPVIVFTRDDGAAIEASATFFTDTAPPPDSAYYWVRGIDMFGRVSEPSAPTALVYRAPVVIEAPVLLQSRVSGDTVLVSWQPAADSRATRYQVWRADSSAGPFVRIGQPVRAPLREQRDPGRPTRRVIWYRVTALDDAGHESEPSALTLAEVPDREPPAAPDSLASVADTGRIMLRWRHVAATDLRGYRVYRSIDGQGSFALLSVTPTVAARFVDTIPARADHPFFYRITAVDSAFNESQASATHTVSPPDGTPPSAPRIARVHKLEGAIGVSWLPNPE